MCVIVCMCVLCVVRRWLVLRDVSCLMFGICWLLSDVDGCCLPAVVWCLLVFGVLCRLVCVVGCVFIVCCCLLMFGIECWWL